MGSRALPDLKARIQIDTTDLPKAEARAKSFGTSVTAGFKEPAKEAKSFKELMESSSTTLGAYGEESEVLGRKLGGLQGLMGSGALGGAALALTATLGIGIETVKSSIEGYVHFGEEVLNFQRVTGMTAEASSRMVDVFGQLGISAEAGDKAMVKLAKSTTEVEGKLPASGKALEALGVTIARTNSGSTDLSKTLGNIADAYNASDSAATRDTIVFQAFGRAGAALIPMLEQGSAGLDRMTSSAQRVFDQQQLEAVHAYGVEMAKANQQIGQLKDVVGGPLMGAMGGFAKSLTDETVALEAGVHAAQQQHGTLAEGIGIFEAVGSQTLGLAKDSTAAAEATQAHTAAMKALDESIRQTETDMAGTLTTDQGLITAQIAQQRSAMAVKDAQKALADELLKDSEYADKHTAALHGIEAAQDKVTQAVARYGPKSDQAAAATDALNRQVDAGKTLDQQYADQATSLAKHQLDLVDAMVNAAKAAETLATKQADAAQTSLSAAEKAQVFRDALQTEMATLAPGSPLRANLQAYIDMLNNIPRTEGTSITATIAINDPTGFWGSQHPGRQHGGSMVPGEVYTVGEQGPETVVMGRTGAYVIPNSSSGGGPVPAVAAAGAAGRASSPDLHVHINGQGMNEEQVALAIDRRFAQYAAQVVS
jgi:hypothetical protein